MTIGYFPEFSDGELKEDLQVIHNGKTYVIPRGFRSDGASIPRWLWWMCGDPKKKPRLYAAIVHDWLYDGGIPGMTRREADLAYREMLLDLGVERFRADAEYVAVRIFGSGHWMESVA